MRASQILATIALLVGVSTPSLAAGATIASRRLSVTSGSPGQLVRSSQWRKTAQVRAAALASVAAPSLSVIDPNIGQPGQTVTVMIVGIGTNFLSGTTQVNFGAGISVGGGAQGGFGNVTVKSATSLVANITLDPSAIFGPRDVIVTTGNQQLRVAEGFTVEVCTTTPPYVLQSSPGSPYSYTPAPLNTRVVVQFNEPMKRSSVSATTVTLQDSTSGQTISAQVHLDASGRIVTLTPANSLPVAHSFVALLAPTLTDACGNSLGFTLAATYFNTGFAPQTMGPSVVGTNPQTGDTGVGTNAQIQIGFNEPIDPLTLVQGFQVTSNGQEISGFYNFQNNNELLYFAPAGGLAPNTTYTVNFNSALADVAANSLTNPGTLTFTTGGGPDTTPPQVIATDPANGSFGLGLNTPVRATFNKPINSLSITSSFRLINANSGASVPASIAVASDRLSATLTPTLQLLPQTNYYATLVFQDVAGNYGYANPINFGTGTAPDSTGASVIAINPPNLATGVPVNTQLTARFSDDLDPTSINSNSFVLLVSGSTSPLAGSVSLGSDLVTLSFTPSAPLASNGSYTLQVGNLADAEGNPAALFTSTFSTSSSSVPDTTPLRLLAASPPNGASNIPVGTTIQLVFNKAVDALTVGDSSLAVFLVDNVNGWSQLAGSYAVNGSTAIFTPATPLPGNSMIDVRVTSSVTDIAGNAAVLANSRFSTARVLDTTSPTVIAASPGNGASDIGLNATVVVTFSKSLNPISIYQPNAALLLNGDTLLQAGASLSTDNRTLTFSPGTLPANAVITVELSGAITDLSNNHLAPYRSSFTTAAAPAGTNVVSVRPGNGATGVSPASPIVLFTSTPLTQTSAASAMHVSQNGSLVSGSVRAIGNTLEFTPGGAWKDGATVQVFLDTTAQDIYGNYLTSTYTAQFTVIPNPSSTAPQVVGSSPVSGAVAVPPNAPIDIAFSEPVNSSTVTGSNIYLTDATGAQVAGTLTILNPSTVRLLPNSVLAGSITYQVTVTTSVTNQAGLSLPFPSTLTFTTGTSVDMTPGTITGLVPLDASTQVGTNAQIGITFSKPVDPLTVGVATVSISTATNGTPGSDLPSSITFNSTSTAATIVPQAPLPPSATVTVTVAGVQDAAGNTFPRRTVRFTTSASADVTPPQVIGSSVTSNQMNVPTNAVFSVQFNKPMNIATLTSSTLYLNNTYFQILPSTLSASADATTFFLVPNSPLPVGSTFFIGSNGAQDLQGNVQNGFFAAFTTGFAPGAPAPAVVGTNPVSGLIGVATNVIVQILFNEPVQSDFLSGVTLSAAGVAVQVAKTLSNGGQTLSLTPAVPLSGNTLYTLTAAGVQDIGGTTQPAPTIIQFTTAPGADFIAPQIVSTDPVIGASGVGTNAPVKINFNKAINPLSLTNANFTLTSQNQSPIQPIAATVVVATNGLSATLIPKAGLLPDNSYSFQVSNYTDVAGNTGIAINGIFTTSSRADAQSPIVVAVNPPNRASNVPVNVVISARLSDDIDPTSVTSGAVALTYSCGTNTCSVPGSVTLINDSVTLTFLPQHNLTANRVYTLQIGGFQDTEGNAVISFASTFSTSLSAVPFSTPLSLVSSNPASGAASVPVNTTFVLTFNSVVDALSVSDSSLPVYVLNGASGSVRVAGTYSVTGSQVTFTPLTQFPTLSTIDVRISSAMTDWAGNPATFSEIQFTTNGVTDSTPPSVIAVSPQNGASNVGLNAPVVVTFSKSINPLTVNPAGTVSVALFNGDTLLTTKAALSPDNRSLSFNTALPASSAITLLLTNTIADLSGNLLSGYRSRFSTVAPLPQSATYPTVTSIRPQYFATTVDPNAAITIFTNAPIDSSTVDNGFHVSANGVLVTGATKIIGQGQGLEFTPAQPFAAGSTIQVFFNSSIQDTAGFAFNSFSWTFTIANNPAQTAPVMVSSNPLPNFYGVALNTPVDVQFSENIDSNSINSADFYLTDASGNSVAGAISLLNANTARFLPSSWLLPYSSYTMNIGTGISNTAGLSLASAQSFSFFTSASSDTTPGSILGIAPAANSQSVAINADIILLLSKVVDPLTVSPATVQISATTNGVITSIPWSLSTFATYIAPYNVTLSPNVPLPPQSLITVSISGIQDLAGNSFPPLTAQFTTGTGADTGPPFIVRSSIDNTSAALPTNAVLTFVYNKPLDPASVTPSAFNLFSFTQFASVPVNVKLSSDGLAVSVVPTQPLSANSYFSLYISGLLDTSGNLSQYASYFFTTAAGPDATPPQVQLTNPAATLSTLSIPINSPIQVQFDRPVDPTSLSGIILSANGTAVPITESLANGDRVLTVVPATPLLANANYALTVKDVADEAGIRIPSPFTMNFVTGSGLDFDPPSVVSVTPAPNSTAPDNTSVQVVFNKPMNPISFDPGDDPSSAFYLLDFTNYSYSGLPATLSFSPDLQTVTLTPAAPLISGHQYAIKLMSVYYTIQITDIAGNLLPQNQAGPYIFTAQ